MTDTAPRSGRAGRTAKVLVQRIDADTDALLLVGSQLGGWDWG